MAKLIVRSKDGTHEIELGTHDSIGRHLKNRIRIPDPLVSKEHCLILQAPGGEHVIRDLASQNGTYVNHRRIQGDCVLETGDTITFGGTSCVFMSDALGEPVPEICDGPGMLNLSKMRSNIAEDRFLPEREIRDERVLRSDYEKLRVAHELQRDIGLELNIDRVLNHILDRTSDLLDCDRAIILLADENGEMSLRAFRTRTRKDKLIISSTLVRCVQTEKVGIISADALTDERFEDAESILIQHVRSSMAVPIVYEKELLGVMIIDSSAAVRAYGEKDLLVFGNIAHQTAQFIKIVEMAKKIEMEAITRERFQRLLSPDLAEMVVSGKLKVEKGGESRTATVLFADIRGFTSMCENMQAAEVLNMLNEFFEFMVDVAFRYEGTVDKFVGDMIMVVWGAPVAHSDDPVRAVQAAVEMQSVLKEFNGARMLRGQPEIRIGIGINTGELVAGYIGSTRTMSYSVIGDAVNIAARLCSAAGADQILISESTHREVRDHFAAIELAPVHVKGKAKPVEVFLVPGENHHDSNRPQTLLPQSRAG